MGNIYDVVIIGSGPAGLSAAIYAQRARLNMLVIETDFMSGGQVLTTYEVDNYPGLPGISGMELGKVLKEHADKMGCVFVQDHVEEIVDEGKTKKIICEKNTYETKTVILASGAKHRKLGVPGEDRLSGMGVSYCATCDGAFYRGKTVAVVGGGDVAVEDAILLARSCEKVYLLHRRDELRAARILQERLMEMDNVEILWNTIVEEIEGEFAVDDLVIENTLTREKKKLPVSGVFIAVGITPNSDAAKGKVDMTPDGYVVAAEDGVTSVPGIFVAGDVRTKQLRQILTAAADGANCITSVQRYLLEEA